MSHESVILIPAIPAPYVRHKGARSDLSYLQFSLATWRPWCAANDVRLIVADRCVEGELGACPPTVQRWKVARDLLTTLPAGCRLAVVDGDTMVRWDAPNFTLFQPGQLSAVRSGTADWIWRSIEAYQRFFPSTTLNWCDYFNAGVVVVDHHHIDLLDAFLQFYWQNRAALEKVQAAGDFGTDQTPLNFVAASLDLSINPLSPRYNLLHCLRLGSRAYVRYELGDGSLEEFARTVLRAAGAFDFIANAYVWHFTHTVRTRFTAMQATWEKVKPDYIDRQAASGGSEGPGLRSVR
jgi:hypothetical protein